MAKPRKAAPPKAPARAPKASKAPQWLVPGYLDVAREPLQFFAVESWLFPATVDMRHTSDPTPGPHHSGSFVGVHTHRADYLKQLILEHHELAEVPEGQLRITGFYPDLTADAAKEARRLKRAEEKSKNILKVMLVRLSYGLVLDDVVPLVDAGLVPPGATASFSGESLEVRQRGKLIKRLAVSDLLSADLGSLLSSEVIGLTAEIHLWPTLEVCPKIRELEAAGQAFLVGYTLPEDDQGEEEAAERLQEDLEQVTEIASGVAIPASLKSVKRQIQNAAWKTSKDCH